MWTSRCLPWTTREPTDDTLAPGECRGGFCHACEGCDLHCNCADTDETRHIAGMNLGVIP